MTVKVKVYDGIKYDANSKKVNEVIIEKVESIEVKVISDEDIYADGFDMVDDYKEYAILNFADGKTSTFRNSYVDIFAW